MMNERTEDARTTSRPSKTYAGIGSRQTPPHVCHFITTMVAPAAHELGFVLATGDAMGADAAFVEGARTIGAPHTIYRGVAEDYDPVLLEKAYTIAKGLHPKWNALGPKAKLLIARNSFQILGPDLETPVDLVIYWDMPNKKAGGTKQGLRLAHANDIPTISVAEILENGSKWNIDQDPDWPARPSHLAVRLSTIYHNMRKTPF